MTDRSHAGLFRIILLGLLMTLGSAMAATDSGLEEEARSLKKAALDLNRDLFLLEEELLYPASTQVTVFLSMDVGTFFALDAVELQVNGKEVTHYLYTEREVDALYRGGVQKLYLGNLKAGEHELVAFFTGRGPHGREYKRGTTVNFEKTIGPKYIELRVHDEESRMQPEFMVNEWE